MLETVISVATSVYSLADQPFAARGRDGGARERLARETRA